MRSFTLAAAIAAATATALGGQTSVSAASIPGASASLAKAPDRYVTLGDVRLRYRTIGTGEPLILLHGLGDRLEVWQKAADSLARDYRVIAVDHRGFGLSSKPVDAAAYGFRMADDVVALMDALQIGQAHIAGHSMGGLVAANVALRHPERVRTATFVAAAFLPGDSASQARFFGAWIDDLEQGRGFQTLMRWLYPTLPDSLVRSISDSVMQSNDPRAAAAAIEALPTLNVTTARAAAAHAPAHFVAAPVDPILPGMKATAAAWPGADIVIVPGADHDAILLRPELVTAMRAGMRRTIR